jgi:hypothetical protein
VARQLRQRAGQRGEIISRAVGVALMHRGVEAESWRIRTAAHGCAAGDSLA